MRIKSGVYALIMLSVLAGLGLSCSAAGNLPSLFASATPTATATFTPTLTPTSTATPTLTPTATPKPTGVIINQTEGGAAQFIDYDGGYMLDIPAEWAVTKVDAADIEQSVKELEKANPSLAAVVKAAQEAQPGTFRIIGFDQDRTHSSGAFVSNFNVTMFQDTLAVKAPMDVLIQASIENIKAQVPGIKIKQLETKPNAHGVMIGAAESQVSMKSAGAQLMLFQKQLYFQTEGALVVITFSAPLSVSSAASPAFDKIRDGIQLIKP